MRKIHINNGEVVVACVNGKAVVKLMLADDEDLLCIQYIIHNHISLEYGAEAQRLIEARIQNER